MHTYDCIFWAGPLDISDILSVQYKIKSKSKTWRFLIKAHHLGNLVLCMTSKIIYLVMKNRIAIAVKTFVK